MPRSLDGNVVGRVGEQLGQLICEPSVRAPVLGPFDEGLPADRPWPGRQRHKFGDTTSAHRHGQALSRLNSAQYGTDVVAKLSRWDLGHSSECSTTAT